jgi:hypothetical protein
MESGSVGYIRLREFNALAEPNVARAVESLRVQGARSFVLDLRDNPGGLVQAGVEIARLFLAPGTNVAYTEGRVVAGGVKGDTDFATTADAASAAVAVAVADSGSGATGNGGLTGLFSGGGSRIATVRGGARLAQSLGLRGLLTIEPMHSFDPEGPDMIASPSGASTLQARHPVASLS